MTDDVRSHAIFPDEPPPLLPRKRESYPRPSSRHRDGLQRTARDTAASGPSNDLAQATRPDRLANGALDNPTANLGTTPRPSRSCPIAPSATELRPKHPRWSGQREHQPSLSKWFQLAERAKAQFRWETFNTTNHTNLNLPAVNLDKSNAGTITKAKAARVMQLGLRLEF